MAATLIRCSNLPFIKFDLLLSKNISKCPLSFQSSTMAIHTENRRAVKKKAYDGLLLDAGGTLLQLSEPVEVTYAKIGKKYGLSATAPEIKQGFKRVFSSPWPEQQLRYQGDGKPFWKLVVSEATGCADASYFNEVYEHYASGHAWHLPDGTHEISLCLKNAGGHCHEVFSCSILLNTNQIGVDADKAIHVGDDKQAGKGGANALGINCWLLGKDVNSFSDIRDRILVLDPWNPLKMEQ